MEHSVGTLADGRLRARMDETRHWRRSDDADRTAAHGAACLTSRLLSPCRPDRLDAPVVSHVILRKPSRTDEPGRRRQPDFRNHDRSSGPPGAECANGIAPPTFRTD